MRTYLLPLLKAFVSLVFLAWIARALDPESIASTFRDASLGWLLLAALCISVQIFVMSWRWQAISSRIGIYLPWREATLWMYVGQFLNGALPTSIGGDAFRVWLMHNAGADLAAAVRSVLIERVSGVVVLGIMVSLAVPWIWSISSSKNIATGLAFTGPVLFGLTVLLAKGVAVIPAFLETRFGRYLSPLSAKGAKKVLSVQIICLAFMASTFGFAGAYFICLGVGIQISFPATIALVGGAVLISVLPISFGGWGVREAGMVALMGNTGIDPSKAVSMSLLWGVLPLALSLPVFVWWIASGEGKNGERLRLSVR